MWCFFGMWNCRFAIDRQRRGMLNWNCGDIGLGVFLLKVSEDAREKSVCL